MDTRDGSGHTGTRDAAVTEDAAHQRVEALYRQHARNVLGYLLRRTPDREDAADLLAEVFTTAWRRRHDIPAQEQARLWLFGVARRTLANHHRAHARRSTAVIALAEALLVAGPTSDEHAERVRDALDQLPEHDREVLTLVTWEELTPSEAAVVLDIPASSARTRLQRARTRLRRILEEPTRGDGGHVADDPHSARRPRRT